MEVKKVANFPIETFCYTFFLNFVKTILNQIQNWQFLTKDKKFKTFFEAYMLVRRIFFVCFWPYQPAR